MNFYQFVKKESEKSKLKLILLTAVSGLSCTGVLAIINVGAQNLPTDSIDLVVYASLFVAMLCIFGASQKYILMSWIDCIEEILFRIKLRLVDKIRRTDLIKMEQIGKAEIYNRLTLECSVISQMGPYVIASLQVAIMLVFVFGYIAFMSLFAALLLFVMITTGVLLYHKNNLHIQAELDATNKIEVNFFVSLTNILDGLKEIKLNRKKSNDLIGHFTLISRKLADLRIRTGGKFSENLVFSELIIYLILGSIVFVLPQLIPDIVGGIVSITTAFLFSVGPLNNLVSMIPVFGKINAALINIYALEKELDLHGTADEMQPNEGENRFSNFASIVLKKIFFEYANEGTGEVFSVGPIDLTIKRGEVLFIVGGNGSGKTTLLKMLTMLYRPLTGTINVDETLIGNANYLPYRELFTAIFYDFHLFDKLYGLKDANSKRVYELLKLMKIENKTEFKDNGFTKIDLSSGQRKRLALIVAFLEDKPIYIFDEWAANQDPRFKDYFYDELLTKLKGEGKTVIAASHDDRYYHLADRIIKLENGKIV